MKTVSTIIKDAQDAEAIVVFGNPQGDELPQVAGLEDILVDVYSDILNVPREYAAGRFHHQYDDEGYEGHDGLIH